MDEIFELPNDVQGLHDRSVKVQVAKSFHDGPVSTPNRGEVVGRVEFECHPEVVGELP